MKKVLLLLSTLLSVLLLSCKPLTGEDIVLDEHQLRHLIVRPTLRYLEPEIPYSKAAENLLIMTAAHESHLGTYIKQVKGPAEGIYQMEPNTASDIWDNYLNYKPDLADKVRKLCTQTGQFDECIGNLYYATAMARVHYRRVPESIPLESDHKGLAKYAKEFYNTHLGKATWEQYRTAYYKAVGAL